MTVPPCMMESAGQSYAATLKEMGTCTSQGAFLQQQFRRWATRQSETDLVAGLRSPQLPPECVQTAG